jgi:hypothetical protein
MDPEEFIRGLVSVGLVVTMSLGASCHGASGSEINAASGAHTTTVLDENRSATLGSPPTQRRSRSR